MVIINYDYWKIIYYILRPIYELKMKGQIKLNDYLRLRSESDLKEMVTLKGEVSRIIGIYKKNILKTYF